MSSRAIDHVVWAVEDLEAATIAAEAVGFRVTPRASHPDPMGTANALVQFGEHNFIEFLQVDRPEGIAPHQEGKFFSFGAWLQDFVTNRQGIGMLVFASRDASSDSLAYRQAGLAEFRPFSFGRKAVQPNGEIKEVAFRLAFAIDPNIDKLACFACENRFPENFWKTEYQQHNNTARGICKIVVGACNDRHVAEYIAKAAHSEARSAGSGWRIACGDKQEIHVVENSHTSVLSIEVAATHNADFTNAAWGQCQFRLRPKEVR